MGKRKKIWKLNWKAISDKDQVLIGTLIKGYTYSVGDYHNDHTKVEEKYFGNPKLRVGVVIEVFSNKIFKVQFANSAAIRFEQENKPTNKIHCGFQNSKNKEVIHGTDAYCMLL